MKGVTRRHTILTTPTGMASHRPHFTYRGRYFFQTSDPESGHLGSGGGTIYALRSYAESVRVPFDKLLDRGPHTVLHAGGQSRRLPAYAITGKLFLPVPGPSYPALTLLDNHIQVLKRVEAAAPHAALIIAAGDILLPSASIPAQLPPADVVILTLAAKPEECEGFGVCILDSQGGVKTFLQKPKKDVLTGKSIAVDTGLWILSPRAVELLTRNSSQAHPAPYELYAQFGLSLGSAPLVDDAEISALSCRSVMLPGSLQHLGTNRHLLEYGGHKFNAVRSAVADPPPHEAPEGIWIESCDLDQSWRFEGANIVTGVPTGVGALSLEMRQCLDIRPVGSTGYVVRMYGVDDTFRGSVGEASTTLLGQPVAEWLSQRHLSYEQLGIDRSTDIQDAALFPVVGGPPTAELIAWLLCAHESPAIRESYLTGERLAASQIPRRANLARMEDQADNIEMKDRLAQLASGRLDLLAETDLRRLAIACRAERLRLPNLGETEELPPLLRAGLLAAAATHSDDPEPKEASFKVQRQAILDSADLRVCPRPYRDLTRVTRVSCPIRLDLAGSWSDTPPYCMQRGGDVINVAATLAGKAPIEVFLRPTHKPVIRLISVDLDRRQVITTYEDLVNDRHASSGFALARAAVRLAGFDPEFQTENHVSLADQLTKLGGGLTITMAALTPTGSGLGTSSILGNAILAGLSDVLQLGWTHDDLSHRTFVLEQIMGSGGGWQDQYGGMLPGLKRLRTDPGLVQTANATRLDDSLLRQGIDQGWFLLYDTGLTRRAFDVLGSIVTGMFLNDQEVISAVDDIKEHVARMVDALSGQNAFDFGVALRRTWELKCRLDSGTSPPPIQELTEVIDDLCHGYTLLGAGGGGFLLIAAKSQAAGEELRRRTADLPGQFVDFDLSDRGLQIS